MSWNGVKKQSIKAEIENWCEEMGLKGYTINSQGEIDVDGMVSIINKDFKELPYKFGRVNKVFLLYGCQNLTSLKNCPNYVKRFFSCEGCINLDSLEGCPKEVGSDFYCMNCKREFTKEEVMSLCKVKKEKIYK